MAFSPAFLDELNARNPIEDVVGQYVALTRRGNNLFGLCPFHSEKTPSFSVSPEKGIYYCFGCHKGGSAISFIMEIENLSYPDAVRFLAKRFAVKEAAAKAFGTGIRNGLAFNQFEVFNDELGKPRLRLWGEALKLAEKLGVVNMHVTLADERHYACATVIIES